MEWEDHSGDENVPKSPVGHIYGVEKETWKRLIVKFVIVLYIYTLGSCYLYHKSVPIRINCADP